METCAFFDFCLSFQKTIFFFVEKSKKIEKSLGQVSEAEGDLVGAARAYDGAVETCEAEDFDRYVYFSIPCLYFRKRTELKSLGQVCEAEGDLAGAARAYDGAEETCAFFDFCLSFRTCIIFFLEKSKQIEKSL